MRIGVRNQGHQMKLFNISHFRAVLMLLIIASTGYLILKPVQPDDYPQYKVKNIILLHGA
jgi:hypothetical protein